MNVVIKSPFDVILRSYLNVCTNMWAYAITGKLCIVLGHSKSGCKKLSTRKSHDLANALTRPL